MVGIVGERLEEGRGARAQGAVGEDLQGAQANPVVAEAGPHSGLPQRTERREGVAPHVETGGQLAASPQVLVGGKGVDRRVVLDARHPNACRFREGRAGGGQVGLVGRLGNRPGHEVHRVVLQEPGRLARGVPHDRPARYVRRPAVDSREPQGQRVGESHVPVQPAHEQRMLGRHRVDERFGGLSLRGPGGVVPVSVLDPGAAGQALRAHLDAVSELLLVPRAPQVHREEAKAAIEEMHVGIVESGHHEAPVERR